MSSTGVHGTRRFELILAILEYVLFHFLYLRQVVLLTISTGDIGTTNQYCRTFTITLAVLSISYDKLIATFYLAILIVKKLFFLARCLHF